MIGAACLSNIFDLLQAGWLNSRRTYVLGVEGALSKM